MRTRPATVLVGPRSDASPSGGEPQSAINPVHQSMDDARDSFSASQTVGRIIRAGRTCRFGRVCDRCSRWNSEGVMPALCRKRWLKVESEPNP